MATVPIKLLKSGDIVLFRGTSLLSRSIQYFDKAYYNHIGIIDKHRNDFIIIDSNAQGVKPDWLSLRLGEYIDACVIRPIRPQHELDWAIEDVSRKAAKGIKYDYALLPRIAISRKFGVEVKRLGSDKRDICSEFVKRYTSVLGIECYNKEGWITPQDFLRYLNPNEIEIIWGQV